jgi:archaetidylinositol phosphate synthase
MQATTFNEAKREQVSLLAPMEKKVLIWLAYRTPGRITSDHLTVLGLLSLLGAGLSYWYSRNSPVGLALATVFLGLNWLGDSLDGTLARIRNRQRPRYGFYVDHIVDAFGTLFLLGGLAFSGYMTPEVTACLLIAYFILSIEVYLSTYTIGAFHLSFWKFSPTELRILLAIGNVALFYRPIVQIGPLSFRLFDVGGAAGVTGMAAMLIWAAVKHTRHLYRLERLP